LNSIRNDGHCTEPCEGVGVVHPYHGVGATPVERAGFAVGDRVVADTYDGLVYATVTAVGSSWLEVDGQVVPTHVVPTIRKV
jgi:hypothetical protein